MVHVRRPFKRFLRNTVRNNVVFAGKGVVHYISKILLFFILILIFIGNITFDSHVPDENKLIDDDFCFVCFRD